MDYVGKKAVFDIETDNLLDRVTTIHCISVYDADYSVSYRYEGAEVAKGIRALESYDILIGHNIVSFDIPVMERLYSYKAKTTQILIDTMLMGYIDWPERNSQTLESWGTKVGASVDKVENRVWSVYTKEIGDRCDKDVIINWEVFQWMDLRFNNWKALSLETKVAKIQVAQETHGVYIDEAHVHKSIRFLDKELVRLAERIRRFAPKEVGNGGYAVCKSPYLKGSLIYKAAVTKWFGSTLSRVNVKGPYSKLIIKDFDINSPKKLKDLLLSLGWRPVEYNRVFDKDTKKWRRTSPKITENSYATIPKGLGEDIATYYVYKHRRGVLSNIKDPENKGLLAHVKKRGDGRVPSRAITCGTPTSRFRHQGPVCNIPAPRSIYGSEVRKSFSVHDNNLMVGGDLSSIEARILGHYCHPLLGGKELCDEILHGDWHSENAKTWGVSRFTAKPILYALMYGAGGPKLARIAGYPDSEGEAMKASFYTRWPCVSKLISNLERAYKRQPRVKGIAGRIIHIREKRTALNSLLQHSAAEVFKQWMISCSLEAAKFFIPVHQIIAYHDELQYEVYTRENGAAEEWGSIVSGLAFMVGETLGVRVPIAAEYKIGRSWMDTH